MSNQIFDILQSQMTDQVIDQLSNQLGNQDRQQTATAATGVINTLVGALARNASDQQGAQALNNALDRDHDGGILDNLLGVLTGGGQGGNQRSMDGFGILMNLLGGDQSRGAIDMVSKMSGMDRSKIARLMITLAPIVLGAVSRAKKQGGMDLGGLTDLLTQNVQTQRQNNQNPTMNLITRFLDKDGDGNVMDEVASIGMKVLGGLFRK